MIVIRLGDGHEFELLTLNPTSLTDRTTVVVLRSVNQNPDGGHDMWLINVGNAVFNVHSRC
jgi:hypothetical protein